jgi:transcriptional regulator with XRE-family HTH domain
MPRRSRLELPPVDLHKEPIGLRIARIRKQRGLSQAQLADRIGIIQALVSAYERGKLRLAADMAVRFAQALAVTTDELLQPAAARTSKIKSPSLKLVRRMERIEALPTYQQRALLTTIDSFIAATETK